MADTDHKLFREVTAQKMLAEMVKQSNALSQFSHKTIQALTEASGAGLHNAIPRCKNIGGGLTADQSAAIRAGTFDGVFVGDFWPIAVPAYSWTDSEGTVHNEAAANVTFRIADCDYYLRSGDAECTAHHVVVVPDTNLYTVRMNATDSTEGGYVGSEMYTNNLLRAKALFAAAFGANHLLTHREYLVNAVKDGKASGGAWFNSCVELMDERMVYGAVNFDSASPDGTGANWEAIATSFNRYSVSCKQLNLFRHRPDLISNRQWYWLRNVVSAACFARVGNYGRAVSNDASNSGGGVRPAALIY